MGVKNHQYYVTVDIFGLKFRKCNNYTDSTQVREDTDYRLLTLNNLGLRFMSTISVRHEETELPVVIAIFEENV